MGEVYKARDTRLDRTVAIKVSHDNFGERFDSEARAVAALNHPNICTLHDVGPNYLVMEYVDGAALNGPLPLPQALRYAAQICDALDAAHCRGITHRDLKPANILVTRQGIKLLDFGLSKRSEPLKETDATRALTEQGAIIGTLNYMPPERLQSKEGDARSDIFSFGLVLYEMLTGQRAFNGSSTASVIAAILERPAPSVVWVAPAAVDRVLQRCLAKDPHERWQSVRDLKVELEWIAAGDTEIQLTDTPGRKSKSGWLAWTVTVLVAILAGVGSTGFLHWTTTPPRPAGPPMKVALLPDFNPTPGIRSEIALSPDGTQVVFAAQSGLMVRRLDSLEARLIPGTETAQFLCWSPDSQSIAFFIDAAQTTLDLKRVSVSGGSPQTILSGLVGFGRGAAWGRDGTILYSIGDGPIWRVSENGGKPAALGGPRFAQSANNIPFLVARRRAMHPILLPDGKHYLFLVQDSERGEEAIYGGTLDSDEMHKITEGNSKAEYLPSGHLLFNRGTTLLAQPFDPKSMRTTGEAVPVTEGVRTVYLSRSAKFTSAANGLILYMTGSIGRSRVSWVGRDGRHLATIDDEHQVGSVVLSPDEKSVAVQRANPTTFLHEIWVTDLTRNASTRISQTIGGANPVWSPDGKRIACTGPLEFGIFVVDASGTGPMRLVTKEGTTPAWSPDGKSLAIVDPGGISFLALEGEPSLTRYLEGQLTQPAFSPDGRWMAYASNESGRWEVYVQSIPAGKRKWQISTRGGADPVWRRDGSELFYLSPERKLMVVPVRIGTDFAAGKAEQLLEVVFPGNAYVWRRYSVSADGQRFLVSQPLSEPSSVILLQNWLNSSTQRR
jgi:Tol biopolymer transport system component